MSLDETKKRIEAEDDFIYSKRFDNSVQKLLERYPDGASTKLRSQVLLLTEEEVEDIFQKAILKIRKEMKVEID